jgi:hypothetical protein
MLLKIRLELVILILDKGLGDIWETDESNYGASVTKPRREVKGDLALSSHTTSPIGNQVRKDIIANKAT